MARDMDVDVIRDFEDGTDVLDVQSWGVTDISQLTIGDHHPEMLS